jgi:AmpE protein
VLRAGDLFAVLFWVTVLGFGAALLFVLNRAWLRRHPEHSDWARSLDIALAWIPARLTALALALVGHFGMVAQAVSGRIWRLDDSRGLLTLAADAALGGDADSDEPAFQAGVNRLEALQELMLRALAVWLIFAALWAVLPT